MQERLFQIKEALVRQQKILIPMPYPHSSSHPQTFLGLGDTAQNQGQQQEMLGTPAQGATRQKASAELGMPDGCVLG